MLSQFNIESFTTPPYASRVNGQIQRFHSTLIEIMRCLRAQDSFTSFHELLTKSVFEYNNSFHSTTKKRPIDLFLMRTANSSPERIEKERQKNIDRLQLKQSKDLEYHNKSKKPDRDYSPGEIIYVKIHKRQGTKLTPQYKKETVKENKTTTVTTMSGKVVHKNNIKNDTEIT